MAATASCPTTLPGPTRSRPEPLMVRSGSSARRRTSPVEVEGAAHGVTLAEVLRQDRLELNAANTQVAHGHGGHGVGRRPDAGRHRPAGHPDLRAGALQPGRRVPQRDLRVAEVELASRRGRAAAARLGDHHVLEADPRAGGEPRERPRDGDRRRERAVQGGRRRQQRDPAAPRQPLAHPRRPAAARRRWGASRSARAGPRPSTAGGRPGRRWPRPADRTRRAGRWRTR